ncbi:glycosyltransferase family 1 protein [Rhizophagus irregularis DAOM 181602=DAOM 197198]|nr:glycosyltransferase family 1 protein [Rhizophagus irregularis DAOM 181602=DAOM 197198]
MSSSFAKIIIDPLPGTDEYESGLKIFLRICRYLNPYNLLKLSCVCKKFNALLCSERYSISCLWEQSRIDFTPFGSMKCPEDMSNREFTKLLCIENGCQNCWNKNVRICIYWIPRVRLCESCLLLLVISKKELEQKWIVAPELINVIPPVFHEDPWNEGNPWDESKKSYWISHVYEIQSEYCTLKSNDEKSFLLQIEEMYLLEELFKDYDLNSDICVTCQFDKINQADSSKTQSTASRNPTETASLWSIFKNIFTKKQPDPNKFGKFEIDKNINETKNILVGSFVGGLSHLRPSLEICKILIERGYKVALVAPGNFTSPTNYPSIRQYSTGPEHNTKELLHIYKEIYEKPYDYNSFFLEKDEADKQYSERFEVYKRSTIDFKPDLFLCDLLNNEACFDIAWKFKIPAVGVSSSLSRRTFAPYKSDPIYGCHSNMEKGSFIERFKCLIIQPARFLYESRQRIIFLNEKRLSVGVSPITSSLERIKNSLFLADTYFGFEIPHPVPPLYQEIGPVMQESYPPLTPKLSSFLSLHQRIMYVSFGMQAFTTLENYAILLKSFLEVIDRNIIDGIVWSLSGLENFPTLSDDTQLETSEILNNRYTHIYVTTSSSLEELTPQVSILNHSNTKIFLTHGGVASCHESLYVGKPMLILPLASDQFSNAEKLEEQGVALKLDKMDLHVDDIVRKIEFLQLESRVKINLKRMQILTKINSKRKYRAADLIEFVMKASQLNPNNNDVKESVVDNRHMKEGKESSEKVSNETNSESIEPAIEDIYEWLLKEWITPDSRMGFIRGKYLDVYGVVLILLFSIIGSIIWTGWSVVSFIVNSIASLFEGKLKSD